MKIHDSQKIIKKQVPWIDPFELATKISHNYFANWFFLCSALHKQNKNSKSYIAIFENNKYVGDDFNEFTKIFAQEKHNKMWFGGLNYEALEQFDNYQKNFYENNLKAKTPNIFFSNFALVLEFNHQSQKLIVNTNNWELFNKVKNYKLSNKNTKNLLIKNISSNFTDLSYKSSIDNIKKMISAGDFFQANLTRKFFGKFDKNPSQIDGFNLFRNLMKESPANYSSFINFDGNFIISSSPELFLKSRNKKILSRPIKGTIPRGANFLQDQENKNYLKNSCKEIAENLMIVDLMRNDFSRFCLPKSVVVDKLFDITKYKTIYHLSSQIKGKIDANLNIFDAIKNCFPAGSMTGAPKIKVVEILQQLEKMPRGIYSGAIGLIDGFSSLNLAVVIRTLVIKNDEFEFQVGGGITFDSDPQKELEETYAKALGLLKILNISSQQLSKWTSS